MSHYKLYLTFSRDATQGFNADDDINIIATEARIKIGKNELPDVGYIASEVSHTLPSRIIEAMGKFHSLHKFVIDSVGTRSCREVLVRRISYNIREALEARIYDSYENPKAIIYYMDPPTAEGYKEALKEFGDKFFVGYANQFSLSTENGVKLIYSVNYTQYTVDVWTISLLLWIFRNPNILFSIVKEFHERNVGAINVLFSYLSKAFLENPSWGDGDNSALALSLYCYALYKSKRLSYESADGPASAATHGVHTRTLIEYIRNVFMEVFPNSKSLKDCKASFECLYGEFVQGFDEILLMIRTTKSYQEANKNGNS